MFENKIFEIPNGSFIVFYVVKYNSLILQK